jgi:hypothetical protein
VAFLRLVGSGRQREGRRRSGGGLVEGLDELRLEEPRQPRPLNALGARLATVALRMGLARLLEIHPRTDTGRRWGVAVKRTKSDRQQAALQAMHEDAMIAKAVESMRDKAPAPGEYIAEDDAQLLGERLAKLDDNAIHITDK